jgi:cytochrome c-type biogenesis protein CcmE
MNPRRRKMLFGIIFVVLGVAAATALGLKAFQENLLYFYSPSQIVNGEAPVSRSFRIGGMVVDGSVKRDPDSLKVSFVLTDTAKNVVVNYEGILPDLFREGQGIVANGQLDKSGVFVAEEVLAKHDENYMPPEVAEALANAGAEVDYGKYTGTP